VPKQSLEAAPGEEFYIVFHIADDATNPQAVPRGALQDSTGTAWFDNLSLTEGTDDGSLTVTGGDQTLEVTQ
jgi:hypothetical protein